MRPAKLYLRGVPSLLALATSFPDPSTPQRLHTPKLKSSILLDFPLSDYPVQEILEHQPAQHTVCDKPTGPIETTLCDYESVDSVNSALYNSLHELVQAPFFKYFRTDLYRDCPFWHEDALCTNRGCIVSTVDETEIPPQWRAEVLSRVESPTEEQRSALPGCYYRDSDFCFVDNVAADGEYFDLTQNPERFTGYSGPSAHRVWASIYEENCFGISEGILNQPISEPNLLGLEGVDVKAHICEEKRVYYRIISGLHASISMHICRDYLDQSTGKWGPNMPCFLSRIASHPERLQHIYFNTVLLLRAVARLSPYLSVYDYCSTPEVNHDGGSMRTKQILESVMATARIVGKFDEGLLFRGENAYVLKEEFKKHFRNVSQIMDCVGCNKCRLWGKVQVSGLGTALKVLFELDEKTLDPKANPQLLQRSEVVALMNTLHRFTESLVFVDEFRQFWAQKDDSEKDTLLQSTGLQMSTSTHPARARPSPLASSLEEPIDIEIVTVAERLKRLLHACGRSTSECVQLCARLVGTFLNVLYSIFKPWGGDYVPKSDL